MESYGKRAVRRQTHNSLFCLSFDLQIQVSEAMIVCHQKAGFVWAVRDDKVIKAHSAMSASNLRTPQQSSTLQGPERQAVCIAAKQTIAGCRDIHDSTWYLHCCQLKMKA